MQTGEAQLWLAHPSDLADERVARACAALLNVEEQQRWQSFRFEAGRRQSLATRALARIALSHAHPTAPEDWNFAVNAHGKPAPMPDCGLRFNLSNCDGLVVCLVAAGAEAGPLEVGVDVEPRTRAAQILRVADTAFSPLEKAQLDALPAEARLDRALSLWTLKEAYIKARGLGLSLPLKGISFVFDEAANIHMELAPEVGDDPQRWSFCLLDHAEHRIAMMLERSATWRLSVLDARPLLAPPQPVTVQLQGWFSRG